MSALLQAAPLVGMAAWRASIAALPEAEFAPCPGYPHGAWPEVKASILRAIDAWGDVMERQDLSELELFGVHRLAGIVRVDSCGALTLFPGAFRVAHVARRVIRYGSGNAWRQTTNLAEAVPIWAWTGKL